MKADSLLLHWASSIHFFLTPETRHLKPIQRNAYTGTFYLKY